jgi:hypothetical protein
MATGGSAARTLAARAKDSINAADYGARCDGTTDDAPAINAALDKIRTEISTGHFPVGRVGRFTLPRGTCLIKTTVNMTGLYGSGFVADLWGSLLKCRTNGTPCIDATGLGQASILGLNIWADGTTPPNIGLSIGRITNDGVGADHLYLDHPTITGTFTLAPFFNNQSETTTVSAGWFTNFASNAYGAIFDGSNHFNIQSAFTGKTYPADTYFSNNENTCLGCQIGTYGANSVPMWIGGTARYRFSNTYVFYFYNTAGGAPKPAVQIYSTPSIANDFLDLDIHIEGKQNLTSAIQFIGTNPNPVIHGLSVRDNFPMQNGPFFALGSGVTSVTIQDADIRLGVLGGGTPSWWDTPSAYTVAGRIYSQDGTYVSPASHTGTVCSGTGCVNTLTLPSNLTAGSISNPGGVSAINLTNAGSFNASSAVPSCSIASPPPGGQAASCTVTGFIINGYGSLTSTGTGYAVNDLLNFSGGTCTIQPQIRVTSVSGGAITGFSGNNAGGNCTVTPPDSNALVSATGSGSGAVISGATYKLSTAKISITPGSGYSLPPAISFSAGFCGSGCQPIGTTSLSSTMSLSAGNGVVLLDGAGTKLGIAGAGGSPTLSLGAFIDNSGVRQTLTGSGYTVPANTSLVRFTQTGTIATQTVTLPTALADGQPLQFVNYAGAVTALTFSPAVNGWTNGSTLAANTGLRIRWDATAAAWYREQ